MSHSHGHSHSHEGGHSHSHGSHSHQLPAPPPPYPSAHDDASSSSSSSDSSMDHDSRSSDKEDLHKATVVATFDSYLRQALSANQRRRGDFYSLPAEHRALLPGYSDLLNMVDERLVVNEVLVKAMVEQNVFPPSEDAALRAKAPSEAEHERLRSTLRQCVRDWSEIGKEERDTAYRPILDALEEQYKDLDLDQRAEIKILVPGAGLARLAWEVVRMGFSTQANEFSLYMLIASSLLLNNISHPNQFTLHPYLHSFSNFRNSTDLLAPVQIPDVLPSDVGETRGDFSFAAGDFLEVYRDEHGTYSTILTCFFLDTARNIVSYLLLIHQLLKEGGTWINLGPTLWHFENTEGASSVELTMEEVKRLAERVGFRIENEKEVQTCYTSNPRSLLRHEYTAAFWTATKL
ncbi:N2227-like protein-domain-containing protein [Leucosporidium creatinivorum]|uniref:carnosine N-methyltransferase n=1 Tax=Leucosporidium creatinivorum TaxID=106004 RepID=A0A1Y2FZ87_9BASI|nr:N2227-like protein-domain-containing protein [Leucosporidium creatinivorum]